MYNDSVVIISVKEARNFKEKIQGLIGKDKPQALLIRTHFGIHTFGLKFPIDVLILNKENKVVAMKKNIQPKKIFFWNPIYEKVLELPLGTIEKKRIEMHMPIDISIL